MKTKRLFSMVCGVGLALTLTMPSAALQSIACSQSSIAQLMCEVEKGKFAAIDRVIMWKSGELLLDERFTPRYEVVLDETHPETPDQYRYNDRRFHPFYQGSNLHTLQSATKSVNSLGIGLAVRDGFIASVTDPAIVYLKPYSHLFNGPEWSDITIEDLLTMRSGIDWTNPDGDVGYTINHPTTAMEVSDHWVPQVLAKPVIVEPGTAFDYNDGVSFLLGEIIHQATGLRTDKYIARELFKPLDIEEYHWKITPAGETDTEGGLYLKPEDLGKIGLLVLSGGKWKGTQIVPSKWMEKSFKTHIQISAEGEETAYGYQWWISKVGTRRLTAWSARGFGGQFLMIVPELDMVVVLNGWSSDPSSSLALFDKIVREHE